MKTSKISKSAHSLQHSLFLSFFPSFFPLSIHLPPFTALIPPIPPPTPPSHLMMPRYCTYFNFLATSSSSGCTGLLCSTVCFARSDSRCAWPGEGARSGLALPDAGGDCCCAPDWRSGSGDCRPGLGAERSRSMLFVVAVEGAAAEEVGG